MTRYSPRCRPRKVGTLLGIGQGEVRPLHDRTPDDADTVDLRSVGAPRQLSRRFRASFRSPPGHRRPSQTHPGQVGNPIPDLWTVWSSRSPRRILWLRPEWVSWKSPRKRKAAVAASKPCRPVESLIAKDGPRDARPPLHPIGRREIEGETIKFTLTLPGGIETESVLIPIRRRDDRLTRTLCVSSQVGRHEMSLLRNGADRPSRSVIRAGVIRLLDRRGVSAIRTTRCLHLRGTTNACLGTLKSNSPVSLPC